MPLSDEARRGVEKLVKSLANKRWPVRWEAAKKWHVTLAFLGWIEEKRVAEVIREARIVKEFKVLELRFKGLGVFPDWVAPRVVWLNLKGDVTGLAQLSKTVKAGLEANGLPVEKRAFVPHVTIGRIGREVGMKLRSEMGRQIKKLVNMDLSCEWRADRVVVYESQMRRTGSKYIKIEEYELL